MKDPRPEYVVDTQIDWKEIEPLPGHGVAGGELWFYPPWKSYPRYRGVPKYQEPEDGPKELSIESGRMKLTRRRIPSRSDWRVHFPSTRGATRERPRGATGVVPAFGDQPSPARIRFYLTNGHKGGSFAILHSL